MQMHGMNSIKFIYNHPHFHNLSYRGTAGLNSSLSVRMTSKEKEVDVEFNQHLQKKRVYERFLDTAQA